jgi:hypothetical protein
MEMAVTERPPAPPAAPVCEGFLLKRAFLRLAEGAFLVSGDSNHHGQPRFAGPVASREEREAQWNSLRAMHLTGRRFRAFRNLEDYRAWRARQPLLSGLLESPSGELDVRIH